jgi:hypothetical protein
MACFDTTHSRLYDSLSLAQPIEVLQHAHPRTHTHPHTHTHTHTHTKTHTHTHTHTHAHAHTRTHTRIHTHTCTHPRTHTHKRAYYVPFTPGCYRRARCLAHNPEIVHATCCASAVTKSSKLHGTVYRLGPRPPISLSRASRILLFTRRDSPN